MVKACDPDYTSGEDLYHFPADGWEKALESFVALVKDYLQSCCTPNQFTTADCISAGFVDGDLEIIYYKYSRKGIAYQRCPILEV